MGRLEPRRVIWSEDLADPDLAVDFANTSFGITAGLELTDAGLIGKLEPNSEDESDARAGVGLIISNFDAGWFIAGSGVDEFTEAGLIGRLESKRFDGPGTCLKFDWLTGVTGGAASSEAGLIGKLELSNGKGSDEFAESGAMLTGFGGGCARVSGTEAKFVGSGLLGS